MTAHPRLSIGLPVYNGEEYLAESLDALLGQTYEDFELVISDNASTDGTQDICRRYAAAGLPDPVHPAGPEHRRRAEPQLRLHPVPRRAVQVGLARRPVRPGPAEALRGGAGRAAGGGPRAQRPGGHRRGRQGEGALRVQSRHRLAACSGALPQPAVRARGRRLLRGDAGRRAAPGEAARQLPPRGPHVRRRDHPARALPPGAGAAVLPPRPPRPAPSGRTRPSAPGASTSIRAGPGHCTRRPVCSPSTSGGSSPRSGGRRCPRPTGARATGTWPRG
ncbi:hypothetical protein STENM223S_11445 [Streptomyces tendae]